MAIGTYQTMTTKSAISITRKNYQEFFVVFVVKPDDFSCDKTWSPISPAGKLVVLLHILRCACVLALMFASGCVETCFCLLHICRRRAVKTRGKDICWGPSISGRLFYLRVDRYVCIRLTRRVGRACPSVAALVRR